MFERDEAASKVERGEHWIDDGARDDDSKGGLGTVDEGALDAISEDARIEDEDLAPGVSMDEAAALPTVSLRESSIALARSRSSTSLPEESILKCWGAICFAMRGRGDRGSVDAFVLDLDLGKPNTATQTTNQHQSRLK